MGFWRTATLALLILSPAAAWSPEAHRAVARVAGENLGDNAKRRLRFLLGSDKLEDAAAWSDSIIAERPETEAWHSITLPVGAKRVVLRRDCPVGDCVTAKLRDYVGVVRLAYREKSKLVEGLKFVVDLTADLHQPLNVGKPPGEGEDDTNITLDGQEMSLYDAWNRGFLDGVSEDELAASIRLQLTPENLKQWRRGHIKSWTWETHETALDRAYETLEEGQELPSEYVERARAISHEQLAKAAARLAALIDEIWP